MKTIQNRWFQLFLCVMVFIIISGPQYQWALFVKPLLNKHSAQLSQLQIVFSLVVVCMTFITPLAGYFNDRFNSKLIIGLGLMLNCASWILASLTQDLTTLYLSYGIMGGLGAGIAFIGCTGLVQKNFKDKRGLSTGILMSGYALGPLLFTYAISQSVNNNGVDFTLYKFGFILLVLSLPVIALINDPHHTKKIVSEKNSLQGVSSITMLKSRTFWLMFFMMSMIATCGMMITSNIAVVASEHGIGNDIIAFGMAALPLALLLDRITNGLSRIVFGMISDKIGRELTLGIAFLLEGLFMFVWYHNLHDPLMFILLSGLVFLAWGEIFSIFPALCTDTFGEKNASVNFGFLYSSVGIGSILGGPIAARIREDVGSWDIVFYIIIALDFITAFLAFFVLRKSKEKFKESIKGESNAQVDVQDIRSLASST